MRHDSTLNNLLLYLILALLSFTTAVSCGEAVSEKQLERPLIGGIEADPDYNDNWPYYMGATTYLKPKTGPMCSAVRVGPNMLLTAAHCVLEETTDSKGKRQYGPKFSPAFHNNHQVKYLAIDQVDNTTYVNHLRTKKIHLHPNMLKLLDGPISRETLCGDGLSADIGKYPYAPDLALIETEWEIVDLSIAKIDGSFQSPNRVIVLSGFGGGTTAEPLDWPNPLLRWGTDGILDFLNDTYNGINVSVFMTPALGGLDGTLQLTAGDEGGPAYRYYRRDSKKQLGNLGTLVVGINRCTAILGYHHGVPVRVNLVTRLDNNTVHSPIRWLASLLPKGSIINQDSRTRELVDFSSTFQYNRH